MIELDTRPFQKNFRNRVINVLYDAGHLVADSGYALIAGVSPLFVREDVRNLREVNSR